MIRIGDRIPDPRALGRSDIKPRECVVVYVEHCNRLAFVVARTEINLTRPDEERPRYVAMPFVDWQPAYDYRGPWSESDSCAEQIASVRRAMDKRRRGETVDPRCDGLEAARAAGFGVFDGSPAP